LDIEGGGEANCTSSISYYIIFNYFTTVYDVSVSVSVSNLKITKQDLAGRRSKRKGPKQKKEKAKSKKQKG
jgi:hypothetical protein